MSLDDKNEQELDVALVDFLRRHDAGELPNRDAFVKEYPGLAESLTELLDVADCIEKMAGPTAAELFARSPERPDSSSITLIPHGHREPEPRSPNDSTLPHTARHEGLRDDEMHTSFAGTLHTALPTKFGDYILEKILGHGGMGVVYLASQLSLDRKVAVKMIRSGGLASPEEVQRFYAEAKSAAKLDHPNIVTVYQCGEHNGHHYFSMDFIPGTDLAKIMAQGKVPARDAARYVRDVARAIAYAHQQGVVHRDLKPANVLINERDEVVVTDFGLAKWLDSESGLTATGTAIGTPSYMSPEQATGKTNEHGEATDVYSLGAVLFALLTGRPPFHAESVVQTMMQVVHKPAPQVRQLRGDVHADLETIVAKCLHKIPYRRYATAQELADDLDRFLEGAPIAARPLSKPQKLGYWAMGIPLVAAVSGYKSSDPSIGQRWAQRFLVTAVAVISFLTIFGRSITQKWLNDRLPSQISIAAGTPGGAYHTLASHLAEKLNGRVHRSTLVDVTEGSADNVQLLLSGKSDLAMLQATSVQSVDIAVVAPLYYEAVHLLVRNGVDGHSLQELKGKRLSLGSTQSGSRQASKKILDFFDLKETDFEIRDVDWFNLGQSTDIDAAIVVMKSGQPAIAELLVKNLFRLESIQQAMAISLEEPSFHPIEILPTDYPASQMTQPLSTVATTAFLAARRQASTRLIRESLAALYDNESPIPSILSAERAAKWQGLAWHPAARAYFEELTLRSQASSR